MNRNTRKIEIYSVETQDISFEFDFETELNQLEIEVLQPEIPRTTKYICSFKGSTN